MQWNIENIVICIIKHLQISEISALDNPSEVDIPLNRSTKSIPIMVYCPNNDETHRMVVIIS